MKKGVEKCVFYTKKRRKSLYILTQKQKEVISTLETLEQIWDEYQVYSKDELNMVDNKVELSGKHLPDDKEKQDE